MGTCYTLKSKDSAVRQKILGGSDIEIKKVPYFVQLKIDGRMLCGGALITDKHVLSAKHCHNNNTSGKLTVLAGTSEIWNSESGVEIAVKNIFYPPGEEISEVEKNDIMLLEVSSIFYFTFNNNFINLIIYKIIIYKL